MANFFVSAFHTVEVDLSKFFTTVETDLGKFCIGFEHLFHKAPNALYVVNNFLNELAPVVEAAVTIADPVVSPEVAAALGTAQTAMAALYAMVNSANTGTTFLAGLENFVKDIPATLTALDIKDAALKSKIEWIANFIVNEGKVLIPAVEAWVKALAGAAASSTSSTPAS